jgi:hypothetical protein
MWVTAKFVVSERVLIIEKFRTSALHSSPIQTFFIKIEKKMYETHKNTV